MGSLGRDIANIEMYIYFKDCNVAKSHKLREVIERDCISIEFVAELKETDAAKFQENSQTT